MILILLTLMAINIQLSKDIFNDVYIPALWDTRQTQHFFGGSSSGKSAFVLGQRTVLDLMAGGRNFLICRNIGRTNRDSTFAEISKGITLMGLDREFELNKTDMRVTCKNGYQALFRGLDDVEKVKSITPIKGVVTDVIIEEATEVRDWDKVKQLRKRMRGIPPVSHVEIMGKKVPITKRMTFLYNPVYKTHPIYTNYFAGKWDESKRLYTDERTLILKTTYKDNKFLDTDEIYDLENENNEYFKNVYTYGNWGVLGAVIFTNWKIEDLSGVEYDHYRNGLDFGYASDPAALVRSARKENRISIKHGVYYRGMVNEQLAETIKPIINREVLKCDCSEPKSIAELKRSGITATPCKKGKDSVLHGIQWLQGKEIIVDRNQQEMINELSIAQWDKDKDGNVLPRPIDRDNHLIDALRYSYDGEMNYSGVRYGQLPF